jgi:hypothetical protein
MLTSDPSLLNFKQQGRKVGRRQPRHEGQRSESRNVAFPGHRYLDERFIHTDIRTMGCTTWLGGEPAIVKVMVPWKFPVAL